MSYQKSIIAGNAGRDAEMRYTPSGKQGTTFSVATERQYTNNAGERVKETTWFKVEICNQYVKKGDKVLVDGRMKPARAWKGKDGEPRASLEMVANEVKFLGSKRNAGSASEEMPEESLADVAQNELGGMPFNEDDIPF